MNFSRRNFIKLSGIASLTSLGLSQSTFGQSQNPILLNQSSEIFRNLIGSDFFFSSNEFSTTAILAKVTDFPNKTKDGECFSLEFHVRNKRAKEATYQVFQADLGNFELFVTDGRNGKNQILLATINYL
jgi:hypothetical protein